MDKLRLFSTQADYEDEAANLEYPTVSYIEGTEEVMFIPEELKYKQEYLTFEALEAGTFTLNIPANVNSTYMTSVSYSTDDGENWTTTTVDDTAQTITTPTINAGDKVLWKGVGKQMSKSTSNNDYSYFSSTGNFNVSGNIMSLLYGDDFQNNTSFNSGSNYNFSSIFRNAAKLTDAVNLILPATTLTEYCYTYMFSVCTSLTTAPVLPATTLAYRCYYTMFAGCTSLTTAPILPATTLADNCYGYMFYGCTALTAAPVLPATTLADSCYQGMFSGCTSLTTAPELPATTLASYCYNAMFYRCSSLTTAPELPATTLASNCYNSMFYGCSSLTTSPELPATTLADSCYYSMFNGCTSLTTAPELPATTLADSCYYGMFSSCTSLTTAPELPAVILQRYCYSKMFAGCTNLNYIKMMAIDIVTDWGASEHQTTYDTENWVQNVASTGTFVKNSAATWNVTGVNGIPSGWTVQNAQE